MARTPIDFFWLLEHLVQKKEKVWLLASPKKTAKELKKLFGANFANLDNLRSLLEYRQILKETDSTNDSVSGVTTPVLQKYGYVKRNFRLKFKIWHSFLQSKFGSSVRFSTVGIRNQGIGSKVLQELMHLHPLKKGQSWKAVVNQRNKKAAEFFKKHGWSVAEKPDEQGMLVMEYKQGRNIFGKQSSAAIISTWTTGKQTSNTDRCLCGLMMKLEQW